LDAQAPLVDRVVAAEWLGLCEGPQAGQALLQLLRPDVAPELARPAIRGLAANIEGRWKSLARGPELLGQLERWTEHEATRADALRLAAALGTRPLNQWRLSPAYAAPGPEGFDKRFPPEEGEAPERAKDWVNAKVGADGMVDLAAQRRPNTHAVGYAVTLIDAAHALQTRLLCGSDDGLKIWLNGKVVHSHNVTRAAGRRQDVANLQFHLGLNRLLVKVHQGTGGWGFIAEVEDTGGVLTEVTAGEVAALADPKDRLDPGNLPSDRELLALKGDSSRGGGVFLRATTACAKCHSIGGQGAKSVALGPALDGIGKRMGRDALLESILRPDAKIAPQWTTWTVITADGRTRVGLIAEEKAESITLTEASGKRTTIAKTQIEDKKPSGLSVMPQRLVGNLSRQELADLLQFLVEH
jgi:putative heme-binding domain-containing protein